MLRRFMSFALLLALGLPLAAIAGPDAEPVAAPADTTRPLPSILLPRPLVRSAAPHSFAFELSRTGGDRDALSRAHVDRLLRRRHVELTRFDYALQGAGAGAQLGMMIGALGNSAELWDEDASWYLVGAAAMLGAIFGGTAGMPEDSAARVQIVMEP